jgi:copper resistance protein C
MRRATLLLAAALVAVFPTAALAHGEIESTIPEADATLKKPPNHLIINFTEAPTKDAVFKVVDGCGTNVIDQAEVQERVGHIFLTSGAQPGKWKVSYKIVSAVDGHPTKGGYGLTVKGQTDCSEPDGSGNGGGNGNGGNGGAGAAGDTGAPAGAETDDGGSFPIVPVALGTIAVVALAFLARRAAG